MWDCIAPSPSQSLSLRGSTRHAIGSGWTQRARRAQVRFSGRSCTWPPSFPISGGNVAELSVTDPRVEPLSGDGTGLEPISKSSEEDNEAGELDKAEEVLSVILPADEDATLPLYPGEEALDEPAPHVTA